MYSPNPWMILPFGVLLACMAFAPLHYRHWWEQHYPKVAFFLAAFPLAYYGFYVPETARSMVAETARNYAGFIVLIGALYVVAGGVHISLHGNATPARNVLFLALGAVVSNVLGTTGAAMLLIRPWLRMNGNRATAHHVVFFIFIIANAGGGLTPIGDPPLLVGYLSGVPFWWVAGHCWLMWLAAIAFLLAAFYILDKHNYSRSPEAVRLKVTYGEHRFRLEGLYNLAPLAIIIGAVFVSSPPFVREGIMLAAAGASFLLTNKKIHEANRFSFGPILEVAILFFGIFATMMPALDYLRVNASRIFGPRLGPSAVFWESGTISGFLDSAPAYLGFLQAMRGLAPGASVAELAQRGASEIVALSLGTVLFGALTYLGNGPNLMVKAIASHEKVRSPAFLAYIVKWAVPILLPLLIIEWLVFFR